MKPKEVVDKIRKIIKSCETEEQMIVAHRYINLLIKRHKEGKLR